MIKAAESGGPFTQRDETLVAPEQRFIDRLS
jgi:hypothetical protein